MNSTAMDQIGKYWGLWGARRSSSSNIASPVPSWAAAYGGEPSWEEQAFARDAAVHLGGCVWPPRSYSCTFCQREFRSAQALGGHMNVHRRDRALLRQGSSPEDVAAPHDQPQLGALLYGAASNPSTTAAAAASATCIIAVSATKGDVNTTPPTSSYISTIIKESKNKLFMSMPAASASMEVREDQATDQCDHDHGDDEESGRTKRRRLDHPSMALPIFVQPAAAASESQGLQGVDHDAKVPQTTTTIACPSSSSPLVDQQGVDLELRLGTTPKVT